MVRSARWRGKGKDLNLPLNSLLFKKNSLIFLLGYIPSTGGIHCDNSKLAYIVHWLDHPSVLVIFRWVLFYACASLGHNPPVCVSPCSWDDKCIP
jgi:hypothetical protein